jgi:hypothetical protein
MPLFCIGLAAEFDFESVFYTATGASGVNSGILKSCCLNNLSKSKAKRPMLEIFHSGVSTQIRPVWVVA